MVANLLLHEGEGRREREGGRGRKRERERGIMYWDHREKEKGGGGRERERERGRQTYLNSLVVGGTVLTVVESICQTQRVGVVLAHCHA